MKKISNIPATSRISELREYYLNNSPMSINRDLVAWKSHRPLMLYVEGWIKNPSAATARLRRSMAEAYMLENTKPVIIPKELIVGQPDFRDFSDEEQERYNKCKEAEHIIPAKQGRLDHLALDYQLLLENGINGILEILEDKISQINPDDGRETERYEYYLCCKIELESLLKMCDGYAKHALYLSNSAEGEEKKELLALHKVLKQVPANPARTFREALQSIHMFTRSLYGLYSFGKPDLFLLPYYKRDIEAGIMTAKEAQELIDCFVLQSIPNMSAWAAEGFMLGGRDQDGSKVENELTWHFLTAIAHTHIPDPNVGFCVTEETGEDILNYAAQLIADGHCQPQIWNNDEVSRSMLSYGFDKSTANMFTLSTCVEVTPIGCSGISITSPYINLLKVFLDAFDSCDNSADFEEIFARFTKKFSLYCDTAIMQENLWQLERGRNSADPMRTSILIHDCLERGLSHDSGGARYNQLEPNILGMQNVTESLNVISQLVFEERAVTIDAFKAALEKNYEGYDDLLFRIRNKAVHFGTGDPKSNAIAKRVADMVLEVLGKKTTVRGAKVIPGAFSYREHEIQGSVTPASPDGRQAGMPLNDASSPVQGYDNLGPTLSLASTVFWEPSRFLGGTSVNVKINTGVNPDKIVGLIKGYLKTKGVQLQFNIVDTETLLDAQKNPGQHGDLLVRIGGYSDFFVRIPKSLQDEVISRTSNVM